MESQYEFKVTSVDTTAVQTINCVLTKEIKFLTSDLDYTNRDSKFYLIDSDYNVLTCSPKFTENCDCFITTNQEQINKVLVGK